jgi:hypothetical protein
MLRVIVRRIFREMALISDSVIRVVQSQRVMQCIMGKGSLKRRYPQTSTRRTLRRLK